MKTPIPSILSSLKAQLESDLPGASFQNLMSPIRDNEKYRTAPDDHRVACVMAIFHQKNDDLYLTFIKRASSHPADKHAGQIGFPGGKYEEDDKSLLDCALREVEEEIGIPNTHIKVLGQLTPLYVFASNFLVYPFVGYLERIPTYVPQISEVAGILETSLTELLHDKTKVSKPVNLTHGHSMEVTGYDIEGSFLWGATAMITSEIEEMLRRAL